MNNLGNAAGNRESILNAKDVRERLISLPAKCGLFCLLRMRAEGVSRVFIAGFIVLYIGEPV